MQKRLITVVVCLALAILVTGFAFAAGQGEKKAGAPAYHFSVIIYDTAGNPWWKPLINGVNESAAALGVKVDIQYAENQPDNQNNLIETAITNKVDGIILAFNVPDAYNKNVTKARAAGIPVVAFNIDDPKGADGADRMAFMGQDFKVAGYLVTKRLIRDGGLKSGDFVVCPVEHPEATYAKERYAGTKRALDEAGIKSEVLETGAVSLEDTLNKLTQYLIGHKSTNGILAMGGMPLSQSAKAVKDAGLKIPVAGFDLTKEIVQNIIDGTVIAAVDQQPYYQGAFPVLQLYLFKKYGLLPCEINTGGAIVDKSTAKQVLALSGTYR
jgi:simple sugar transport system substrate-binding protein